MTKTVAVSSPSSPSKMKSRYDLGLKGTPLLSLVTSCCALGFLLVGYDNGVMGGVIGTPAFKETFNNPSPATLGNIVSLYELGCFIGAMSTFVTGPKLGRRLSILTGSIWMLVGAIIQTASHTVRTMIFGRIVSGIGMGIINSTVPVLQAECSPAVSRGMLVAIDLTVLNSGIVLSYWVGYGVNFGGGKLHGNATWRLPIALQCVFIIGIFLAAMIIPDTPRWYATRGRKEEALSTLARLRRKPKEDESVQEEFDDIVQTIRHEQASAKKGWFHLIKPAEGWKDDSLRSRRRLLLACFIQAAQQLGGINALIYYSSTLFSQSIKLNDHDSAVLAGCLNMVLILGSTISIFLVDRVGRRPLLLPCISLMSLVFVLQTIFVRQIELGTASVQVERAAVAMLFLFELFFSLGFQATVWMIPSEILPLNIRTQGSALSTASNWINNFIVVKFTPSALANIGYRTYIIFAIFNALWVPILWVYLPETKGKGLEEIDELFSTDGWKLQAHGHSQQQQQGGGESARVEEGNVVKDGNETNQQEDSVGKVPYVVYSTI